MFPKEYFIFIQVYVKVLSSKVQKVKSVKSGKVVKQISQHEDSVTIEYYLTKWTC